MGDSPQVLGTWIGDATFPLRHGHVIKAEDPSELSLGESEYLKSGLLDPIIRCHSSRKY